MLLLKDEVIQSKTVKSALKIAYSPDVVKSFLSFCEVFSCIRWQVWYYKQMDAITTTNYNLPAASPSPCRYGVQSGPGGIFLLRKKSYGNRVSEV